ncbi:MAG TPA: hypothetical protein VM791_18735 [Vicinamibacterales bacterium]|nr:hypothetical protein [Vicinamibacterales bacterium]
MEKARLAVVCVAFALASCTGRNVQTATYATVNEARSAGAMEKGYVPSILPANAYELRAAYAVNGHQRWGLFNFPPDGGDELRAILQPEEISLAGTVMDVPGRIEWWPLLLRGEIDAERAKITGLRAYYARSGPLVFAVNWSQGRAYYWTR